VFHSPDSKSSIDTKVGSPPMVRRTSWPAVARRPCSPTFQRAQLIGEGLGDARMSRATRVDRMSNSNSTSAALDGAVIGAALR
jgi:hypothetical protein